MVWSAGENLEYGGGGQIEAGAAAATRFAEYLVKKPAFATEHHRNAMHRFSYFQGGGDNCCDIRDRHCTVGYQGQGTWACRSGSCSAGDVGTRRASTATSTRRRSRACWTSARGRWDLGYTAFGHINPFLDEGHDQVYFEPHFQKMQYAADNVRRMRQVVSDKVKLLTELHRRLTPAEAVTFRGHNQGTALSYTKHTLKALPYHQYY